MLGLGNKDVLIMYLPLFLYLRCWLWANMYCWNADSFMSNLLRFMPQLIFCFTTLRRVQYAFLFVILVKKRCIRKRFWGKSNLWSSQEKTIEIYSHSEWLCGKCLSSPVLYANTLKRITFGWTVYQPYIVCWKSEILVLFMTT